jgi:hypothetical protein
MTKLQSKTWRQWDDKTWYNNITGHYLIMGNAEIGMYVSIEHLTEPSEELIRYFDTKQQALDFIKEFIADDV